MLLEWRGLPEVHCWGHPEEGQMGLALALALPDCCGAVPSPALTPAIRTGAFESLLRWGSMQAIFWPSPSHDNLPYPK